MEAEFVRLRRNRSLLIPAVYECLGTAVIVYAFNLSGFGDSGQAMYSSSLTRALAYFMVWFATNSISGTHLNPAVSLAVFIFERNASLTKMLACFIVAQIIGAFLGIGIAFLLSEFYYA
jgi:glycerol uptake facilitator-like aquaporin